MQTWLDQALLILNVLILDGYAMRTANIADSIIAQPDILLDMLSYEYLSAMDML